MLTTCNTCQNYFYTDDSPLWFHCDKCLKDHQKQLRKKYTEEIKAIRKELPSFYCDGCGLEYKGHELEHIPFYNGYFYSSCSELEEKA